MGQPFLARDLLRQCPRADHLADPGRTQASRSSSISSIMQVIGAASDGTAPQFRSGRCRSPNFTRSFCRSDRPRSAAHRSFTAGPTKYPDPIPFADDRADAGPMTPTPSTRFFRALVAIDRVFQRFRTGYLGKVSPVHLFWGSFDLAVTRFSGRRAPLHPGGIPGFAGCGDARGLQPRGLVGRLLARRRRHRLSRPSIPMPIPPRMALPMRGQVPRQRISIASSANFCCPTTPCGNQPTPEATLHGVSAKHLSGGSRSRPLGSRRARMSDWLSPSTPPAEHELMNR